ncbi:MAG: ArsB/NhaD family transporter, partial [Egibacteraceae bacterium]
PPASAVTDRRAATVCTTLGLMLCCCSSTGGCWRARPRRRQRQRGSSRAEGGARRARQRCRERCGSRKSRSRRGVDGECLNNLPAYLLLSPSVADGAALRGLLAGVNVGANLTTIGSLATLLWLAYLRAQGLAPTPLQYLRWGLIVTPLTLLPALALLSKG